MRTGIFIFIALLYGYATPAQWKPVGDRIKTEWATQIDTNNVLTEYPRPIMERASWKNLNGLWNYTVLKKGQPSPKRYDGKILVPFAIESSLSGVGRTLGEEQELWYHRSFTVPADWKGGRVLLHFGAVDWKADVWVNDIKVGQHTGGFTPFSFDIGEALQGGENEILVKVWDPTDNGPQPRGKQVNDPKGIWYTPVSGIWQTVWLESVPDYYISDINTTPDIDVNTLTLRVVSKGSGTNGKIEVKVFDGETVVAKGAALDNGGHVEIEMPENVKLWSPDDPFLYDLEINLYQGDRLIDHVKSYSAMRKFSTERDAHGVVRLQLNNKELFHFGPLDQGWWPDGLYTAPTDDALLYDIRKTKDLGFNMIRKHIKVEPARWYTHCDRLGMIVWQDMPSGDKNPEWQPHNYFNGTELTRSAESEKHFRKEWKEIIDYLYSYPSIGVWVPFNEAWGQFKTVEIAEWTKDYDPSRLVNPASGGNHYSCGDMLDIHHYPEPKMTLYDGQRANVLGEYVGIGLVLKEHVWAPDHNWGYVQFNSSKEATDEYIRFADMLRQMIPRGFSAAVYTQTTDVEIEVNGLLTYDRKIIKVDEERVRDANIAICKSLE